MYVNMCTHAFFHVWRPEEGISFPGVGVSGGCELPDEGTEFYSSAKAVNTLHDSIIFPAVVLGLYTTGAKGISHGINVGSHEEVD